MYINNTQAETIFDLLAREDEKLSLGEYRLNFLASRQELVELMEKIAPSIKSDGWQESAEWVAGWHRKALEQDLAEKRAEILEKLNSN
jgi:hypothetical protein